MLLVLGGVPSARAQTWSEWRMDSAGPEGPVLFPVNVSLWPALSTNQRFVGPYVHNLLSLGLVIDHPYLLSGVQAALGGALVETSMRGGQVALGLAAAGSDVTGLQVGGFGAMAQHSLFGLQVSPGLAILGESDTSLFSRVKDFRYRRRSPGSVGLQLGGLGALMTNDGTLEGIQLAGGAAYIRNLQGMQAAGLLAWSETEHTGLQVASFTKARKMRGLQLGLVNVVDELAGVQLGLVNVSRTPRGLRLGLVNWVAGFPSSWEIGANDTVPLQVAWRTGTPGLYSLVGVGLMGLEGPRPSALAGLGTSVAVGARVSFSPELVYTHAWRLAPASTVARVLQVRLPVRWEVREGLWLHVGPTLNAGRFDSSAPGYLPLLKRLDVGGRPVHLWPGLFAGVGFRLPWPRVEQPSFQARSSCPPWPCLA
ncbi:hypothetical protein JRI60_47955 [Archangium violaceum]|uniref:LA_2272 family surface repeat-containing protein n=1 Tax=Archangium violaceum TaxID=83451 RepID=UPI001951F1BA|nr:hypothetical protein [Archangium violaceum]QRN96643.1 hypothetical protein JRI60_47955 [Archangium violaceum]